MKRTKKRLPKLTSKCTILNFQAPKVEPIATTKAKNHVVPEKKPAPKKKFDARSGSETESDEDDDDFDWDAESDESSSASDLEPLEGKEMEELRKYFLKSVNYLIEKLLLKF
jgi:hypothetical protein